MSSKPDPSKVAAEYQASTPSTPSPTVKVAADPSSPVKPGRLADLAVFFVGFRAFHNIMSTDLPSADGREVSAEETYPGSKKVYARGMTLLRRYQPSLVEVMQAHVAPLMERAEFSMLRSAFMRASRTSVGVDLALAQAEFLGNLFSRLRSRQQVMRGVFPARVVKSAMLLGAAASQDSPKAVLHRLTTVVPVSGMRVHRAWVARAAEVVSVAPSALDAVIADASLAQNLGEKLREADGRLARLDPASEDAADLQEQRQAVAEDIEALVEVSSDPQTVMATAVAAATIPTHTHVTDIGKSVGLTGDQEEAMMVAGPSVIAAGAGSGKTRVLAAKVVYTIKELGAKPGQIIATSFSRKSAHELKNRIKSYGGDSIINDSLDGFGTTHSVAGALIRRFQPKAGFVKIIQDDQSALIAIAMKQVKMRGGGAADPDPTDSFFPPVGSDTTPVDATPTGPGGGGSGSEETAQDDFNRAIKAAFEAYAWQEDNYGASGWRTSTMNFLRSLKGADPETLDQKTKDAVNKALGHPHAGSVKGRPSTLKTVHRSVPNYKLAAYGGYRSRGRSRGYGGGGGGAPKKTNYYKEPVGQWFNLGMTLADEKGRPMGKRRFGTAISKYKANLTTPGQVWSKDKSPFAAVYGAYEWLKKNHPQYAGRRDHDDTLIQASALLIANPAALSAVQAQYKYLLVDEAQDLNKSQHLLFGLVAGYYDPATQEPNADGSMTADTYTFIGDDKQAIYEFRGADPDVFIEQSDMVPKGRGFKTKILDMNFRSGKDIVDAANKLIAHNSKQIPMVCKANVDRKGLGAIHSVEVATHEAGAAYAAEQIEEMITGDEASYGPGDFGVACRTNAEAMAFGVEMLKKGIPFRSKMNFFKDNTTKAAVAWLRLAAADPTDTRTINEVVLSAHRSPRFWLDKTFGDLLMRKAKGKNYLTWLIDNGWYDLYEGRSDWKNRKHVYPYMQTLQKVQGWGEAGLSPGDLLDRVLQLSGSSGPQGSMSFIDSLIERLKNDADSMDILAEESLDGSISDDAIKAAAIAPLRPLMGLLEVFGDIGPAMDYVGKLQKANTKKGKKDDPGESDYEEPAVVIDTVHGWKGLECKRLFVNMPAGVFPHAMSQTEEEMASERRLAYVALTRGEDSVTVLAPSVNHLGKPAGTSQFISEACIRDATGLAEDAEDQDDMGKTASTQVWSAEAMDAFLTEDWDTFDRLAKLKDLWGEV